MCVRVCEVASVMSDSVPSGLLCPYESLGKKTGVGCHALLQGIFLTQGSKTRLLQLLHFGQILYH